MLGVQAPDFRLDLSWRGVLNPAGSLREVRRPVIHPSLAGEHGADEAERLGIIVDDPTTRERQTRRSTALLE